MVELKDGMIIRQGMSVAVARIHGDRVEFKSVTSPVATVMTLWQAVEFFQEKSWQILDTIPWVSFVDAEGRKWYGVLTGERPGAPAPEGYIKVHVDWRCGTDADGNIGRLATVPNVLVREETPPWPEPCPLETLKIA